MASNQPLRSSPEADFVATTLYRTWLITQEKGLDISLADFAHQALSSHTALREIGAQWREVRP